tara:strand:+ start:220 stop:501 length:282 start_codon:yes stop_codon:yes gene_type:complete
MLSLCTRKVSLECCLNIINTKIIGKNLPSNIAAIRITRPLELNPEVIPVDHPTVPRADAASYTIFENLKSLNNMSKKVTRRNNPKKIKVIAVA